MLRKIKLLNSVGDTIVEVMIVLAVLGLSLSIAYATANRSLLNARQAQENSQATQMLQSQIEALRSLAPNGPSVVPAQNVFGSTPYCVKNVAGVYSVAQWSGPNTPDPACKQNLYTIKVLYCQGSGDAACSGMSTDDNFIAQASWDDVLGDGRDTVTLVYRLHQP
jgi:type II secretory pathway pseudopilin PulG